MAAPQPPNTPGGLGPPHGPLSAHPVVNGHVPPAMQNGKPNGALQIAQLNETVWIQIGKQDSVANSTCSLLNHCVGNLMELLGDLDGAINAYEQARRHNHRSIPAMTAISCILRTREQFPKAIEYLQNILGIDAHNGDVWGSLGAWPNLRFLPGCEI